MISLTVSVDEKNIVYSYEVGSSKETGIMPLSSEGFLVFSDLLEKLFRYRSGECKKGVEDLILEMRVKEKLSSEVSGKKK